MKWLFYLIVFIYMVYRAVYGAKLGFGLSIEPIDYDETGFLPVGGHVTVNCRPGYKDQELKWVDPDGNVIKRNPAKGSVFAQERYKNSRTPVLALIFSKLEVRHSGEYECRGNKSRSQKVSICVIEPSVFVETPTEVSADQGRAITLTCQAKGKPEPSLIWSVRGETLSDDDHSSKYRVSTKYNSQGFESLLTIKSLAPEDSGVYSCMSVQRTPGLEDCTFTKETNISLNVNHEPLFEDGGEITFLYKKPNEIVNLTCSANGFPLPTYRWFTEDGDLVEIDEKLIVYSEENNEATWTITANPITFNQKFICRATNSYGQAEKVFRVHKLEKPRRPDEIIVQQASDNKVNLNITWEDDDDGSFFPVEKLHVQILKAKEGRRKPKEDQWKKVDVVIIDPEEGSEFQLESSAILTAVRDLERNTKYWIRIRAANNAGDSPWSDPLLVQTSDKEEEETSSIQNVSEVTEKVTEDGEDIEPEAENEILDKATISDGGFYGIFFAGGILVIAAVCMFAIRIV